MPCAGPNHSCNTLLSVRSPLGEARLGAPVDSAPCERMPLLRRIGLAVREMLAHRRQRRELAERDDRLLDDIGVTRADAMREARKFPWID
jgi:uncharacterized protein YjiS (DUF1127 family)